MEKAQVGAIQLVEAGEHAANVLEFVNAAFDQMALPVEPGIVRTLDGGALMRWDDRFAASRLKMGDERRACSSGRRQAAARRSTGAPPATTTPDPVDFARVAASAARYGGIVILGPPPFQTA